MANNSLFYLKLKQLQIKSKKSFNQIERELKYPRNALQNYKHGADPSGSRLLELSDYFGVTPEYLIGKNITPPTKSINELFDSLNTSQKKELCIICQQWLLANK